MPRSSHVASWLTGGCRGVVDNSVALAEVADPIYALIAECRRLNSQEEEVRCS